MALQAGITFLERRGGHTASYFTPAVSPLESNALPVKQPVFVQESELAHAALTACINFSCRILALRRQTFKI